MITAAFNEETKRYEVKFVSNGTDVLQTEGTKSINVSGKVEDNDNLIYIRVGSIGAGYVLTEVNLVEGMLVLLSSTKEFEVASLTAEFEV